MKLNEFQRKALETALPDVRGDVVYGALAVAGEAGEFADLVKKYQFQDNGPASYEEFKKLALLELGDVLWSLAQAADSLELSLDAVAKANLRKVQKRYKKCAK